MDHCPECDWKYDGTAAAVFARPVGGSLPVIWDGSLHVAHGHEPADGRLVALGRHICLVHPESPDAVAIGPVEDYAPLAELNAALADWAAIPLWLKVFRPRKAVERLTAGR